MRVNKGNPLVSIIVPVYNAEKYLGECLDSIINQTYTNLEIMLVDDGSKDKSGEICDQYAKKDNRIKVYHKPNSGVSKTRNYGLDHCTGEWVAFVDSDDYIEKDYIEHYLEQDLTHFNVGGHNSFRGKLDSIKRVTFKEKRSYDLNHELNMLDVTPASAEINIIYHICSKLYNNIILQEHHIRFPENMILAEDCCFNIEYLKYCDHVTTNPYSGYYYRKAHTAPVYKMDLSQYNVHLITINNSFNELGNIYDYKFKKITNSLYRSFFTSLKDGLIDKKTNYKTIVKDYELNKVEKIINYKNLYFVSKPYRIVFDIIYRYPLVGIMIIYYQRIMRGFKK